ncbi:MAG: DUF2284 domain-containing protein [Lachnospiraceae bacterium]|nr:DUF2284 domain-containing protein [Lachnospiraceae bacterium]
MSKNIKDFMQQYIQENFQDFHFMFIRPSDLIFEENVRMNCFYCGKYGTNWRCPPHLPVLDYKKMMSEYPEGLFLWIKLKFNESNYQEIRAESSTMLHKALLDLEKQLWNLDSSTALSFIGGSCKLCKNGCGKEKCNNPYFSRSPLEATGCNIVKSAAKYGLDIHFPPSEGILRLGLLLWQ